MASETAIEKFQHEAERNRKAVKDKRLHNTKPPLQNYHCFVEHSKSAVYEASQFSEDDDFEELMEELMSQSDGRVRVPVVRSIRKVLPTPASSKRHRPYAGILQVPL